MSVQVLLTVTLPGDTTPAMQLYADNMVQAPAENERPLVMALLIEALAILSPRNPRHPEERDQPKLRVVKNDQI